MKTPRIVGFGGGECRHSYGRVCWVVVVLLEDVTGAGVVVVCSVVVVLVVLPELPHPVIKTVPVSNATVANNRK